MRTDIAERVRSAAAELAVPPFPGATIARRIAARPPPLQRSKRAPVRAIVLGGAIVLAAAAAAAPESRHAMSDAAVRTLERLTGQHYRVVSVEPFVPRPVRDARSRTRFPIVVPAGFDVIDALPWDHDRGVTLTIRDPKLGVVMLQERLVTVPPSKIEGIGIHDDGSIRRFNVRRWTIGKTAFSVAMFDPHYHAIAERIERATREAAR
jgi:hypothetical protein